MARFSRRYGSMGTTRTISTHPPETRTWTSTARRPPRGPPVRRSVAQWEKDFCESRGVPWKKVTDPLTGLNIQGPYGRVAQWDDSGAMEALRAARRRYWSEINGGGLAAPLLPDPDRYIDVVVDDEPGAGDDPEIEAEYQAAVRDMERALERSRRAYELAMSADYVPEPTGWDLPSGW